MTPRFWRRHLRSLLLLALLHRLNCLTFLAACAPVLLLAAFLLSVVLVHSEVPREDADDRHLYKKIRHRHIIISSSPSLSSSSEQEEEEEDEEVGNKAAVAWTADDEYSIQSIGSLELEREARLEKLMSRRSSLRRNLIDLDVHIPATRNHSDYDINKDPSSAPSSLQLRHPFHDVQRAEDKEEMLTRHESFTAPLNRPSRFRPYFVLEGAKSNPTSTSSSSSSSAPSDHQKEQENLQVKVEEEEEAAPPSASPNWDGNRIGMAVDVELISDSSDDDMSLPGGDTAVISMTREHSDDEEEDSFEVASITQQVAAGLQQQQLQVQMCEAAQPQHQHQQEDGGASEEREVSKIREHHVSGPVPVVVESTSSSPGAGGAGAGPGAKAGAAGSGAKAGAAGSGAGAGAGAKAGAAGSGAGAGAAAGSGAGAGAGAAAGSSSGGKSSSKFKAPSKKAVFGFFRK